MKFSLLLFNFTSAGKLVFAGSCVIAVQVSVSICDSEIELINTCVILSQKDFCTDYAESREQNRLEIQQTWKTLKNKSLVLNKLNHREAEMGIMEGIKRPGQLYSQMILSCS